jgi:hypothetical protein
MTNNRPPHRTQYSFLDQFAPSPLLLGADTATIPRIAASKMLRNAPAQDSADLAGLYTTRWAAVPVGHRRSVGADIRLEGLERLPQPFQTRVPAAD